MSFLGKLGEVAKTYTAIGKANLGAGKSEAIRQAAYKLAGKDSRDALQNLYKADARSQGLMYGSITGLGTAGVSYATTDQSAGQSALTGLAVGSGIGLGFAALKYGMSGKLADQFISGQGKSVGLMTKPLNDLSAAWKNPSPAKDYFRRSGLGRDIILGSLGTAAAGAILHPESVGQGTLIGAGLGGVAGAARYGVGRALTNMKFA